MVIPPILDNKHTSMPSVFAPTALLREARRQKGLNTMAVPPVCILDPDGDLVRELRRTGVAKPFAGWPCYHTELDTFDLGGHRVGIVGRVVGASFAVLFAASTSRPHETMDQPTAKSMLLREGSMCMLTSASVIIRIVEAGDMVPTNDGRGSNLKC